MAGEVVVGSGDAPPPARWDAAVLLVGPPGLSDPAGPAGPAGPTDPTELISLFTERWDGDGRLVVLLPETRDGRLAGLGKQDSWDDRGAALADVVIAGDPVETKGMTCLWRDAGRIVVDAARGTTPAAAVANALAEIGSGVSRRDGEREVPLAIWRTDSFRRWYTAQRTAGNTLLGARVVWTFHVGPQRRSLFYWALHVRMQIAAEDRVKDNEVVLSRPDISVVALYRRGRSLAETMVVLVREFRSAGATPDGFVHELPGGSGGTSAAMPALAADEVAEETGLVIDVSRFRAHGSRQLAATLSAHHAHLFSAEITEEELEQLRAEQDRPHGVADDTERTWLEIATYGEICAADLVDWSTLGMLAQALPVVG
jgi:8-oxo-dGTP pyrophosphatase MutT (NUDIX family)